MRAAPRRAPRRNAFPPPPHGSRSRLPSLGRRSYVKYAYNGVALNELQGLVLRCTPAQLRADGSCPITRGEQTIESLKLDIMTRDGCIGVLVALIFALRVLAYLGIRYRTK